MVAYSFKRFFSPQIATGLKMQTVRADRARHSRPGELIQLYEGMRTRSCRRIRADVTCVDIRSISISFLQTGKFRHAACLIRIDGQFLDHEEREAFARADGFAPEYINALAMMDGKTAIENMARFWLENHGENVFDGVLIRWTP